MACRGEILVVDDDDSVRRTVCRLVAARFGPTLAAVDGRHALELIEAGPVPCLVITDLEMPRMSGDELIAALRARGLGHIPVITMSGSGRQHRAGTAHLEKPFDSTVFRRAIEGSALHDGCVLNREKHRPVHPHS